MHAGLQILYPKLIHIMCLAQGLYKIAKLICSAFPAGIVFVISNVKKVFLVS